MPRGDQTHQNSYAHRSHWEISVGGVNDSFILMEDELSLSLKFWSFCRSHGKISYIVNLLHLWGVVSRKRNKLGSGRIERSLLRRALWRKVQCWTDSMGNHTQLKGWYAASVSRNTTWEWDVRWWFVRDSTRYARGVWKESQAKRWSSVRSVRLSFWGI